MSLGDKGNRRLSDCATAPPSCADSPLCNGESCCQRLRVAGGHFDRGADPSYPAGVADYCLDKYEVTTGRFREFLGVYDAWRTSHPAPGEGAHPLIPNSGWDMAWNSYLPVNELQFQEVLKCSAEDYWTWSDTPTSDHAEAYPINCVNWYEAFAFCIWDGGRIPTEAEWEYAAAGGTENRKFPWGNDETEPLPANYLYNHATPFFEVSDEPRGKGLWDHRDMAGSMIEWTLDRYADPYSPTQCDNCANTSSGANIVARGGHWLSQPTSLSTTARAYFAPDSHDWSIGIRCAGAVGL